MKMNELRRDPVSGIWTIILKSEDALRELLDHRRPVSQLTDKSCNFCRGQEHTTLPELFAIRQENTAANEPGWEVRVIPAKNPVLQIHGDLNNRGVGMYDILDGIGAHELVIETPEHGLEFTCLDEAQLSKVFIAYRERVLDLKRDERFRYVLVHKAHETPATARDCHAYSHIIATPITPLYVRQELMNAQAHYAYKERCLFCDIIHQEVSADQRIIFRNSKFVALAPFASRSPFQIIVLPVQHETFFEWNTEMPALAEAMHAVFKKMRTVLSDFDYIIVLHSGPNMLAGKRRGYWKTLERDFHWHVEITPQLTKFTSFEIGSGFQVNPVAPELAARMLNRAA